MLVKNETTFKKKYFSKIGSCHKNKERGLIGIEHFRISFQIKIGSGLA